MMKSLKRFFSLCLLWTMIMVVPARAGQMTLDQAFGRALAGNPGIQAVEERIRQAREQVVQARAAYYPRLDISSHAGRRDISRNDAELSSSPDRRYEIYDGFLSGKWVLFSGFSRRHDLAAAKLSREVEIQGKADAVRLLLSSVAAAFHSAQLALANRRIASANRAFYSVQLETARIKQKAGVGSLSDVLNFNTRMNQAAIEMAQYLAEVDLSRASLAALLGEDALAEDLPEPVYPGKEAPEEMVPPDPEPHVKTALAHRPDLARLALELALAREKAESARSRFYPELSVTGSVGADRTGSAEIEKDDIEHSLGLELSYPLFAGGGDRAALREALYAANEARLQLTDLENQVVSDVRQACVTVAAAQKQLALYRENEGLVRQNRDMVAKEYEYGKTSLVNLNEVQTTLTETRQRIALSLISLRQAWYELETATGGIRVAAKEESAGGVSRE